MNSTIQTQLNHKSIRNFTNEPISDEIINSLKEVANRTASSVCMQQASIIRITDKEKRKILSSIATQPYIETAPELWIFIVDIYRNYSICKEQGVDISKNITYDNFIQGFTDATLMIQNVVNAIESLNLGNVILGSILNDVEKVIEILNLPKYTYPVAGLAFGKIEKSPELKPRLDINNKFFNDNYKIYDNYLETISNYDNEMKLYYDIRNANKPLPAFSQQILQRFSKDKTEEAHRHTINILKKQGFIFY